MGRRAKWFTAHYEGSRWVLVRITTGYWKGGYTLKNVGKPVLFERPEHPVDSQDD